MQWSRALLLARCMSTKNIFFRASSNCWHDPGLLAGQDEGTGVASGRSAAGHQRRIRAGTHPHLCSFALHTVSTRECTPNHDRFLIISALWPGFPRSFGTDCRPEDRPSHRLTTDGVLLSTALSKPSRSRQCLLRGETGWGGRGNGKRGWGRQGQDENVLILTVWHAGVRKVPQLKIPQCCSLAQWRKGDCFSSLHIILASAALSLVLSLLSALFLMMHPSFENVLHR